MAEQQRGLDHYVSNPGDVADIDAATAARLLQEMSGLPADAKPEEGKPAEEAKAEEPKSEAKAEEPKTEAPKTEAKAEEPGTAVLAPDGKSTIPYAVLQRERERAKVAEGTVGELTEMVDKLTKRLEKQNEDGEPITAKEEGENTAAKDEINAALESLRDEAPDVAAALDKILGASNTRIASLEKQLIDVTKSHEVTERAALQRLNTDVQAAIDSNPALVHWRENHPELYEEAKAFDNMLRQQPAWADRPFSERFAQVTKLVVASHDESVLPPTVATAAPAKAAALTPEQVKAQALAKLTKAAPVPTTITDIPGGSPAEQSEQERIESMDVTQLGAKLMRMSPQEQRNYLAKNG